MKDKLIFSIVCSYCFAFFQLPAQTSYHVSKDSQVKISGTSTLSDWTISGSNVKGELKFNGENNKTDIIPAGEITMADVSVEVASIHSERGEPMDNKIYKALKRDEYPVIRFVLHDPVQLKKANQRADSVVASGAISIAGVTRNISFDMKVSYERGEWMFTGKKSLKMSDFGIEPPSAMFGQIITGDDIDIGVNLIFN